VYLVRSLRKIRTLHPFTNLCIDNPSSARFGTELRAVMEWSEMSQNMSLGSKELYVVRSLRKIPKRHRSANLCVNHPNSARFAPNFMQ
jgi:hypothetical protein